MAGDQRVKKTRARKWSIKDGAKQKSSYKRFSYADRGFIMAVSQEFSIENF
jgi:hypothetical protein